MPKTPISLIVDDSCPLIHVYQYHRAARTLEGPTTEDGRLLAAAVPNDFLDRFCDVAEAHGMAGKFSIVPSPGGRGDVARGVEGFDAALTRQWLDTARKRLSARFDFCPEMITHHLALDLATGGYFPENENDWSQRQDRATLTPYITHALQILKDAGVIATGVTSPWVFGIEVEPEYVAAIAAARKAVYEDNFSWYFLHMLHDRPDARPWVASREGGSAVVSIPSTLNDFFWPTIDSPRTDRAYIESAADLYLTADGRKGKIREVLDAGGWPVILSHWQSLFSNGLETGLAILDEAGHRIDRALAGEVEWKSCLEMACMVVS
ncbi:MAG: hypothetical protein IT210_04255 [Armatimonadetes bacterium]|nr:hypothetical protein [Armatimonadota bacterium]